MNRNFNAVMLAVALGFGCAGLAYAGDNDGIIGGVDNTNSIWGRESHGAVDRDLGKSDEERKDVARPDKLANTGPELGMYPFGGRHDGPFRDDTAA